MSMVCEKHHVLSFKTKTKFEIIPFDPESISSKGQKCIIVVT